MKKNVLVIAVIIILILSVMLISGCRRNDTSGQNQGAVTSEQTYTSENVEEDIPEEVTIEIGESEAAGGL